MEPVAVLDNSLPFEQYTKLNLSQSNKTLVLYDITKPEECQKYIDRVLKKSRAKVAYGGYLEKRNLYLNSVQFAQGDNRNVHLGVDFWCAEGTEVISPIDGKVHSFQNNRDKGDYGPTIVLEHKINDTIFYSLYGHLSLQSLKGLFVGKQFLRGDVLGTLGGPAINVNYAPHLHFQFICDLQNHWGDYPGVCSENSLDFYKKNCPDPNLLFKL